MSLQFNIVAMVKYYYHCQELVIQSVLCENSSNKTTDLSGPIAFVCEKSSKITDLSDFLSVFVCEKSRKITDPSDF